MVGARAPGTEQISQRVSYFCSNAQKQEKWLFLKDALWGGGGTHRSWPGGRGGRGDDSSKEGGGLGLGWLLQRGRGQGRVGLAVGGGARASVAGG